MPSLLTLRAALVFLAAAVAATIAFVLAYLASGRRNASGAALVAGGAAGGTVITINQVLGA